MTDHVQCTEKDVLRMCDVFVYYIICMMCDVWSTVYDI
jgi:hypothetical protein